VDRVQWMEAEDYRENKVSNPAPGPMPVILRSMRSVR
jgi:hypothetical protein